MKLHKKHISKEDIQQLSNQKLNRAFNFLTILENERLYAIDPKIVEENSYEYEILEFKIYNYLKETTKEIIGETMTQKELINHLTKLASKKFEVKPEAIKNIVKKWVKALIKFKPAKRNKKFAYKIESIKTIKQFLLELGFKEGKEINNAIDLIMKDIVYKAIDKLKANYKELKLDKKFFGYKVKNFVDYINQEYEYDISLLVQK